VSVTTATGALVAGEFTQVANFSSGTVAGSVDLPLSGSAATFAAGTLTPNGQQPALVGQAITSAAGVITALGADLTVNITGEEFEGFAGFVNAGGQAISGTESTSSAGTAAPVVSLPLAGIESATSAGVIAPAQGAVDTYIAFSSGSTFAAIAVALSGSEATGQQGTVTITGDAFIPLSGSESASAAGTIIPEKDFALTGLSIASALQSVGAPGGAVLSGSESVVSAGDVFTTNDRTFALTGQAVAVLDGLAVTSYLAFATGQELTISQGDIGPRTVALTGAEITSVLQSMVAVGQVLHVPGGGGHPHRPPKPPRPRRVREDDEEKIDNGIAEAAEVAAAAPKPKKSKPKLVKQNELVDDKTQEEIDRDEEEAIRRLLTQLLS